MPLVIDSLGGRHTYTSIATHMHTDFADKNNYKKPGGFWPLAVMDLV